uniref:P2X purinoceptor n=1 Tax=Tetraodon nigroviridis TaxID=99883 RepID=H3D6H5_TETNG
RAAMGSWLWGFVTDFFTYETTKSVVVKSWSVGIVNRIVQLLIITYFVGWVFIHEKAYQTSDTGIESSVMTKVKGFGYHQGQVMDVADYVFPSQGSAVFCIITKLVITENQFQGKCREPSSRFNCSTDEHCQTHFGSILSSGAVTGVCLKPADLANETEGQCEIQGWCPAEEEKQDIHPMLDVNNFTIFIKNSIRFPLFNVTRGNFPSTMTVEQIKSCNYHPEENPFCPIFRVGDVLNYTGQNITELAEKGGEIGINVEWKCNLDWSVEFCVPKYSFTRLDAPFAKNAVSKGYNFRFAKYFKTENGTEYRRLHKAFAIRFDVMVTGKAGKFDTIPTLINLVAAFTSVGLGTVLCDVILLNFLKGAEQYKAKKFEEVSEAQIEASLARSPGSQLSLKQGMQSSYDSGAISLALSD